MGCTGHTPRNVFLTHSPAQREGKGGPRKWPCRRHKEQPFHSEAGVPLAPGHGPPIRLSHGSKGLLPAQPSSAVVTGSLTGQEEATGTVHRVKTGRRDRVLFTKEAKSHQTET